MNDVGSMSLMPSLYLDSLYFTALLNSNLLFDYYREFINCSVNIQINDLRQIPIIIPTESELQHIIKLANEAVMLKINSGTNAFALKLESLEQAIDKAVFKLYFK